MPSTGETCRNYKKSQLDTLSTDPPWSQRTNSRTLNILPQCNLLAMSTNIERLLTWFLLHHPCSLVITSHIVAATWSFVGLALQADEARKGSWERSISMLTVTFPLSHPRDCPIHPRDRVGIHIACPLSVESRGNSAMSHGTIAIGVSYLSRYRATKSAETTSLLISMYSVSHSHRQ